MRSSSAAAVTESTFAVGSSASTSAGSGAIARAIAPEPALVLADEPTANVDSVTAAALLDLMHDLHERKRVTFLFSTHDRAVMTRAERLFLLRDGRIVADGAPRDVLDGA